MAVCKFKPQPWSATPLGKFAAQFRAIAVGLPGSSFGIYATVAQAEAAFAAPVVGCYVDETITGYVYVALGGAYTIDHETVLATADGGDTRLVAIELLS